MTADTLAVALLAGSVAFLVFYAVRVWRERKRQAELARYSHGHTLFLSVYGFGKGRRPWWQRLWRRVFP